MIDYTFLFCPPNEKIWWYYWTHLRFSLSLKFRAAYTWTLIISHHQAMSLLFLPHFLINNFLIKNTHKTPLCHRIQCVCVFLRKKKSFKTMTVLAVSMLSGNKLYRPFLYFQVYTLHTLEIKNSSFRSCSYILYY